MHYYVVGLWLIIPRSWMVSSLFASPLEWLPKPIWAIGVMPFARLAGSLLSSSPWTLTCRIVKFFDQGMDHTLQDLNSFLVFFEGITYFFLFLFLPFTIVSSTLCVIDTHDFPSLFFWEVLDESSGSCSRRGWHVVGVESVVHDVLRKEVKIWKLSTIVLVKIGSLTRMKNSDRRAERYPLIHTCTNSILNVPIPSLSLHVPRS